MKVSEATGIQLDAMVAMAEGGSIRLHEGKFSDYELLSGGTVRVLVVDFAYDWAELTDLNYSSEWMLGGRVIEREHIELKYYDNPPYWGALKFDSASYAHKGAIGPTPLVAAMRCYVTSKLGDEVDLPEGL